MTDTPLQLSFWQLTKDKLWNGFSPLLIEIIFGAAKNGSIALPERVQILVDWDNVHQDILDYLRSYRDIWDGIIDYTRDRTITVMDEWIRSGEPLDVLESKLEQYYSPERAQRIATTEVTKLYAEGNQAAWKASGTVSMNKWMTAQDERVCPICRPLAGMKVQLGENGFTTEKGGLGITGPPAHINCRCWLQPIVDESMVRGKIREILYSIRKIFHL